MPQQTVTTQKVIKVKSSRKMSLVETMGWIIVTLAILLVVVAATSFGIWMYTFKALTEEKTVAELQVSGRVFKDGKPTFTVRYIPKNEAPAIPFWSNNVDDPDSKEFRSEMGGDQVFIDANFIRWANWSTLVGFKPVYKVYRVKSDYQNLDDREEFKSSAFERNGGQDGFIKEFDANKNTWGWLVQSAYISSAGVNINEDAQKFDVIVTKDGLVLEKK